MKDSNTPWTFYSIHVVDLMPRPFVEMCPEGCFGAFSGKVVLGKLHLLMHAHLLVSVLCFPFSIRRCPTLQVYDDFFLRKAHRKSKTFNNLNLGETMNQFCLSFVSKNDQDLAAANPYWCSNPSIATKRHMEMKTDLTVIFTIVYTELHVAPQTSEIIHFFKGAPWRKKTLKL